LNEIGGNDSRKGAKAQSDTVKSPEHEVHNEICELVFVVFAFFVVECLSFLCAFAPLRETSFGDYA
jgi:hypothetical protein